MTPEQFRIHGRQIVDWVADYMETVERYPVLSRAQPGSTRAGLPASAPEEGEPFEQIIRDLNRIVLPGITHWQSPNFFAYFPANASPESMLADLVSAGLGVQGMMWSTSPAATELETHVLDWLVAALGLPDAFLSPGGGGSVGGGVIQDTASSATLCALIAARERATGRRSNERGLRQVGVDEDQGAHADNVGTLVAYASNQAHSSVVKAARIAGIGADNLRLVDVDENFSMRADLLEAMMAGDRAAGRIPFLVCATIGTTASSAIDPVRAIAAVCREHGAWLHVDAAYAGCACVCPEFRHTHDGVEFADSYTFNPHKWLLTNFDCNVMYVRDRAALTDALSITPEYLRNEATEGGAVIDYRDWHIPLGRRFRALKLWFVIRANGLAGLREYIRRHVGLAREFASWVDESADFELCAPVPFSLVCFRHVDGDERSEEILRRINDGGEAFLTHARLGGRYVLRMAIGGARTERRHVEQLVAALEKG